jgi:hypothetical protein
MLRGFWDCTQTVHQEGEGDGVGCYVWTIDEQLQRGSVGSQHDVLTAVGIDKNVLYARQV